MIIDAKDAILGRLASYTAKKLLDGEKIIIINAELCIITGDPKQIKEKYLARRKRGSPQHGPFFPKRPDLILRRTIRGMLPYKKPKGRSSLKRLKIYIDFPKKAQGKHILQPEEIVKDVRSHFVMLGELAKSIGWSK